MSKRLPRESNRCEISAVRSVTFDVALPRKLFDRSCPDKNAKSSAVSFHIGREKRGRVFRCPCRWVVSNWFDRAIRTRCFGMKKGSDGVNGSKKRKGKKREEISSGNFDAVHPTYRTFRAIPFLPVYIVWRYRYKISPVVHARTYARENGPCPKNCKLDPPVDYP